MVHSTLRCPLMLLAGFSIFLTLFAEPSWAAQKKAKQVHYTPPPIPTVNTPEFKQFVQQYHTFPSPFGFEPYRDDKGHALTYALNEVNAVLPYIPVTFYCNSITMCPQYIITALDNVMFAYPNKSYLFLAVEQADPNNRVMLAYYYPNDPRLYWGPLTYKALGAVKRGEPLVTILFSQRALKKMSVINDGSLQGMLTANGSAITSPTSDGQESITIGTTLSVIGLGVASGVEFSETVSQTTGETFTHQVQTGFSLSVSVENSVTVGGGIVPVSDTLRYGINSTLSELVSNGLEISNQRTTSRTYTIKPGINDTYYWAIYQLLYSYRLNAPVLEGVLGAAQKIWQDKISFNIGGNQKTQDGQLLGNLLPPQQSNMVGDVTVGVAVPINPDNNARVHSQTLSPK